MNNYRTDCYFYCESQEMGAYVPNCGYDSKYEYGFCPCSENCKHYISRKEAYELIKNIVRCKDCKHVSICIATEIMPDMPYYAHCTLTEETHDPDWFCADGEKKDATV